MKYFRSCRIAAILLIASFSAAEEFPKLSRHYLHLDMGAAYGNFRDTGTSPLRYQGFTAASTAGFLSANPEFRWGLRTDIFYTAGIAANAYLLHSFYCASDVFYLRRIPPLSAKGLDFFAGPALSGLTAFTINDAYQNAMVNVDIFSGLFLRSQLQYAFKRPEWGKKLAFLRLQRPARDYVLAFRLDIPVLRLNIRPEFPYVLNGTQTDIEKIFSRHFFAGGLQLQSRLGLTRFLKNGNAIETAYVWEMISTGRRDIYLLESARHALVFAFYFRLN
ncbi:MAG: hypothetical protein WC372_05320 [Candidatus Neomarinimicrobiota bacterium]|jgi:hypothetical protein|nr:hypothetical protein [Candidatus Neomarinimicrobiota bacterium]MDD3966594.1 hypothetical protein [Candidatus Neomarinimicrobiota bacterium]MDX9780976.1 hypothetical protein [bacterium]